MNEHERLARAASDLVGIICPGFVGDLAEALEAISDAMREADEAGMWIVEAAERNIKSLSR